MAITNGYCTLAEFKAYWQDIHTYTAATLSFATVNDRISDTAYGLRRFENGQHVTVSGSTSNDGAYTINDGSNDGYIGVAQNLTDEVAGNTVTITVIDLTDDTKFEVMIEAASRAIDDYGGRRFYAKTTTARYFTATDRKLLFVDDLLSIDASGLVTDEDGDRTYETTWATTDYILLPENASTDGEPYTMIQTDPYGNYVWPVGVIKGVKITGSWGYASTTPARVKEACFILTGQLAARKDTPYAVLAAPGGQALLQLASEAIHKDPHLSALIPRRLV